MTEQNQIKDSTQSDETLIYQTYIASIMTAEQRRSQISTVYASVLAAGVAGLGVVRDVNMVYPAIAILLVSSIWISQVKYFRSLASIKWKTALQLEEKLPSDPFTQEYQRIKLARAGRNHTRKKYADLELGLPRVLQLFSLVYLALEAGNVLLVGEWRFWEGVN